MLEALLVAAVCALLIVLNGLFVAAEFSIISVPRTLLEQEAEAGKSWARRLLAIVSNTASQDRFIAIAQVGITLASLGLGMYGEHSLASGLYPYLTGLGGLQEGAAHTLATLLSLFFLTFWHIVVGEMIPKSLALQFPVATATTLAAPMRLCGTLLAPLVFVLNQLGNLVLRILRLPISQDTALVYSAEEMRLVFDESHDGGLLDDQEHWLLRRVMTWGQKRAEQVMVPWDRVQTLAAGVTREEAVRVARQEQYSRYPLLENGRVVGVLLLKDLVRRPQAHPQEVQRPALTVSPEMPLDEAFERLREARTYLALVVGARGEPLGLITIEDLLEELFGELQDEFDADERLPLEPRPDGWSVAGSVAREDLAQIGPVPDSGTHTVDEWIRELLGREPRPGDRVEQDGLLVEVEQVAEGKVVRARVRPGS